KFAEGRIRRGGLPVASQSGFFNPRVLLAFALCSVGAFLAMLSFAATPPTEMRGFAANSPTMPLAPTAAADWSIVASANSLRAQTNILIGTTCVSASDCWAVGFYDAAGDPTNPLYQTLIERWDGTSWAVVTSANT